MNKMPFLCVVLVLLLAAPAILAQGVPSTPAKTAPATPAQPMSDRVDANGDGAITPEEERFSRLAQFKAADTNGDGTLAPEDYILYWIGPAATPQKPPAKPETKDASKPQPKTSSGATK